MITGSDIQPGAKLGANIKFPHPNGVIIHECAQIGDNCMIMQQVTIGMIGPEGYPVIGSNVYIGAGAKILGNVKIGDNARVGANSVVLCDVPAGATAVGIPARVIIKTKPTQAFNHSVA